MSFNKNIPQPTDRLAKSQQDLLNNNLQLNTSFDVNHYTFDDLTSFNGMHKQCQMKEQTVAPAPVATTDSLYTLVSGGLGELFYVRGGGGTPIKMTRGDIYPLTNNYTPQAGGPAVGTDYNAGCTFLPGGLLFQYGNFIHSAGISPSSGIIKFLRTFTTASSIVVTITAICKTGGTSQIHVVSLIEATTTTTQFQWNYDSSATSYVGFSWTAIGT